MLAASFLQDTNFLRVLYIVAFALFIYGLSGLTGPRTAVRGNRIAAVGMAIAVIATLLCTRGEGNWALIVDRRRDRHRRRRAGGAQGEDDGDAADGRALQRRRRRRGVPDRLGGVPQHRRLPAARPTYIAVFSRVRGDHRLGLLLGLEHRLRQAAGAAARDGRSRSARRSRRVNGAARRRRRSALACRASSPASHSELLFILMLLAAARARELRRAADRRRRHARRDLAAERVHRASRRRRRASRSTTRR